MEIKGKKRLGEILIDAGVITKTQLEEALKTQKKEAGILIGGILVKLGFCAEEEIAKALSRQLNIPYMDLRHYTIDPKVIECVPEDIARKYDIVPLFKIKDSLTVAMSNPLDISAIDEVKRRVRGDINIVVSTPGIIAKVIDNCYSAAVSIKELLHEVKPEAVEQQVTEVKDELLIGKADEYPVVKLVNLIIAQAIKDRASDIHIEPGQKNFRVRYRIDGVLHEVLSLPKHLEKSVISRIKILSGMNITDKLVPQDGHIQLRQKDRIIDFRVATYPTTSGECVAMRLLSRRGFVYGLEELGVESEILSSLEELVNQPYGLILTTGPTGSGKTTTLYSILNAINTVEKKVISIEDPVEYGLEGTSQAQVNPKAEVSFATGLRAILRQDPDIIMVGEIRDSETAQITIQSALTGHLVLSSLHTNDAPSTVTRLIDMTIEPFLVASTLLCSISQRLIRVLCDKCKEVYVPNSEEKQKLGLTEHKSEAKLYKDVGCKFCNNTGYKGRSGIFEVMVPNEDIKRLIVEKSATSVIRQSAIEGGMQTLWDAGVKKVLSGITDVTELLRVASEQ